MSLLTRLTSKSVDMALRMQPRRTARVRDEILYAAPAERDAVEEIRNAGQRMVEGGLCPAHLGVIAVRRSDTTITRTASESDLRVVDNRSLEIAEGHDDHPAVVAVADADAAAAVWAYPPNLLAVADGARLGSLGLSELAETVGDFVSEYRLLKEGVCIVPGRGVLAAGSSPGEAVTRLEAAELLAKVFIYRGGADG